MTEGSAVRALAKKWHDVRWTYWREAGEELQEAIDLDDQRTDTTPVGLVIDLHATSVTREVLECACGWLVKRGPGAQESWRRHLEHELLAADRG